MLVCGISKEFAILVSTTHSQVYSQGVIEYILYNWCWSVGSPSSKELAIPVSTYCQVYSQGVIVYENVEISAL